MSTAQIARALAEDVPAMSAEEVGWLPRPLLGAARAVHFAAADGVCGFALAVLAARTLGA